MVLSPNCAKIKFVASNQNSPRRNAAKKLPRIPRNHEFKNSPKRDPNHQKDPNCQEVQIAKMSRVQGLPQDIQRSKRSMLSKLPRDPSVQELPREAHIVRSRAFPRNCISLYCKRPTIGADEPSVVKANIVQACNQKRVCPALPDVS